MHGLKRYLFFMAVLGILTSANFYFIGEGFTQMAKCRGADLRADDWNPAIAADVNQAHLVVRIDGREYTNLTDGLYMDEGLRILIPTEMVRDAFDCSAHLYGKKQLVVEKGEDILQLQAPAVVTKNGRFYVPLETLAKELGYSCQWDIETTTLTAQGMADGKAGLPHRYDLRERGRAPQMKDQGAYGTCWAFASLTALESALLPEASLPLSVDHMNRNNSFAGASKDGGQYTMAMAYLAAWQGPVGEADDPYGDGKTDPTLPAVRHVQEMQLIGAKDLDGIKKAVFQYGAVETCIYTTMQGAGGESSYYNGEEYAYCYVGEEKPNHDVVIIGWDDSFPRESFRADVADDGAFICQNSWGDDFGDGGVFYVSYYDTNIGIHNLVFTEIEGSDNYDGLYQSDLCGWVGQMGYNRESIYGANVFTAKSEEDVAAAGFYTTGQNTDYQVFIVPEFTGVESLDSRMLVAEGQFVNAGYHTVRFGPPVRVAPNRKFAVVVWLSTPNALRPMAIEYVADDLTQDVDLDDGEGYVSVQGRKWADAREASQCNLCIKAYTHKAQ